MPGSLEGRYIRLEADTILKYPPERIPAGIYISINSRIPETLEISHQEPIIRRISSVGRYRDPVKSSHASPALSVEIRASYEVDRMLGSGEVIGIIQMSWDEVLDHGDEAFELSFPPVHGVYPSLTLKAAIVHPCDDRDGGLFDSIVDCEIARDTDAGHARFAEYTTSKTVSHLNDAVQHFQSVLDQCPVGHPDHASALTNLAYARLGGYIQNDLEDIDTTTSLFREALALRPQARSLPPSTFTNPAQLCCKLLPLCPEGTYLRSIGVDGAVDYVIADATIFQSTHPMKASTFDELVLELCPLGHQCLSKSTGQAVMGSLERFTQRGSIDDIDESIRLVVKLFLCAPRDMLTAMSYLNNLACSLQSRFDHQGQYRDLNEVISTHEEDAPLTRFNHRGVIDDINRAISLHREELTLRPSGHPRRDTTLANLALALDTRYEKLHVDEDLNEAIDLYRESLRLKRHDHPERHRNLCSLSSALCSRFTQTRENEDVEEAIQLCQESLAALPLLHPDRHSSYIWLQVAYLSRYRVQLNPSDLLLAVENFRLASRHPTQGFPDRIRAAWGWVFAAEKHSHASVLEAYSTFFDLLDGHLVTQSSTISRREAAATFSGARSLPVDAASCAIRRDNIQYAVELAEQGRGQQWSLASRLRTPLEVLESSNPKLAQTFSELGKHLSDAQGSTASTDRAAADRAATDYRRRTRQWEAVVAEIPDLQTAARHGPVIILIASEYSCNAIIVPTSGEPHHVPLPSVALADLNNLKDHFAKAIPQASRMNPKEPRNDLIVLLRAVWDEIMLPIVNVLQHDLKLKHQSRIWLCPTAAFTSIPLHAAHPFRTKADCSKEPCLEDLYICSYTPTLSALIRSRQMMKTHTDSVLRKSKALLAVDSELELVQKLVPATANRTTISGDAATRAGALEALEQNTWVHLACHGKQDHTQPYNSHFVMKDEPLTLLDIMGKDIPHAEFAFLSACHTAVGDKETPDEVIHLAAGLQFSGFKSVIGTLWEVDDAVAKHVVEAFYKNMFRDLKDGGVMDCTKAAWALNRATHAVKTKVPLEQRMVFIHIGV
ncbi:CHAT domain-containing protein [Suillus lakei]|nr:CHAT domain-containing protein [Suillus lakei]